MQMTGGCQCGAVRFSIERLGEASLCHCRMCQKAVGGLFGAFVEAHGLTWTRGEPKRFQSSNMVRRGYCGDCGTPLTFEFVEGVADQLPAAVTIGALDEPAAARPVFQLDPGGRVPYVDELHHLPRPQGEDAQRASEHLAKIHSYQHPDHDTPAWPPKG